MGRTESERSPIDGKIEKDAGSPAGELNQETLEEWQLCEIRRMLEYIKRSRFYGEKLAEIDPGSIRSMDDFCRLPLTSEADIAGRENEFLCLKPGDVSRMVTVPTTGTTGGSKRLAFTDRDILHSMEFITVAYRTFMHEGDRMMVMMSGGTQGSIGDVVKHSMDQIGAETCIYGPVTDIEDAFEKIREWKPDVITGIPVQMAALARYSELHGGLKVREVLLSADDVPDAICRRLRRVWGAGTFRHFGMTELCIFGGCECCADMGYHVRHSDVLFEIIDPDEEGWGELAITTFHHEAMPLLRYRTGDIARLDRSTCRCGGRLPRLIGPRGRILNSIGGSDIDAAEPAPPDPEAAYNQKWSDLIFIRDLEEVIFTDPAVIDFECEMKKGERREEIGGEELELCLRHFPGDEPDADNVRKLLQDMMNETGIRVNIRTSEMICFEPVYNSKKKLKK